MGKARVESKEAIRYPWWELREEIEDKIFDGTYAPGTAIPTLAAWAEKYNLNISVVRQVIYELAGEGVLEVHHGRGITVAPPKHIYEPYQGFVDQASRFGGKPHTVVFLTQQIPANHYVANRLCLPDNSMVWDLIRLRYLDKKPVMMDAARFPMNVAERLMADSWKWLDITKTLRDEFGSEGWQVEVAPARITTDRVFSDMLKLPRRTIFYHIERRLFIQNKPVMIEFLVLRSDRFQLRLQSRPDNENITEGMASEPDASVQAGLQDILKSTHDNDATLRQTLRHGLGKK